MIKKHIILKRLLLCILAAAIVFAALIILGELFAPKYMTGALDGAFIAEYYEEKLPHDVVFLGDCEVFSNISPVRLYEDYGITSFVRGSAQQLIWQSYYLLEETLRYETPSVVVFNVLSLIYDTPQNEAYNRITLDGMRMSAIKLRSVAASMTDGENMLEYIFPILRFHSRYNELNSDDIKYLFKRDKVTHNGYYMRVDIKPVETLPTVRKRDDYSFGENALSYLDKITELCKNNGIELVLMKAPSLYPHWYDEWDAQIVEYANTNGLNYINFLALADNIGIDYTTDTFDAGMHMNLSGAEKISSYMGEYLKQLYPDLLIDYRNDSEYEQIWSEKIDFYYAMKDAQNAELAEYGRLIHFGAAASEKE